MNPSPKPFPAPVHEASVYALSARTTGWSDARRRAQALATAHPFTAWPADALSRLAQASRAIAFRRGQNIMSRNARLDAVYLVVEGRVVVGFSAATGRSVVFYIHPPGERIHGIGSLVDGLVMANDVIAEGPGTVLSIPIAAVRAELERLPMLWQSLALELTTRLRAFVDDVRTFVLEPLRPRMAGLLLSLAASTGVTAKVGPVEIGLRLSQERLSEMLGVSRQTATALVRELVRDGLVQWRYGRVTLLDLPRLRALAGGALDESA